MLSHSTMYDQTINFFHAIFNHTHSTPRSTSLRGFMSVFFCLGSQLYCCCCCCCCLFARWRVCHFLFFSTSASALSAIVLSKKRKEKQRELDLTPDQATRHISTRTNTAHTQTHTISPLHTLAHPRHVLHYRRVEFSYDEVSQTIAIEIFSVEITHSPNLNKYDRINLSGMNDPPCPLCQTDCCYRRFV